MTITTSLKQSQRLKELGVKQESEKWWDSGILIPKKQQESIPAYSCSELFEMMPNYMEIRKCSDGTYVARTTYGPKRIQMKNAGTPAQALAELYIKLLEEGIIKPDSL